MLWIDGNFIFGGAQGADQNAAEQGMQKAIHRVILEMVKMEAPDT
jgi:hypothetical protein